MNTYNPYEISESRSRTFRNLLLGFLFAMLAMLAMVITFRVAAFDFRVFAPCCSTVEVNCNDSNICTDLDEHDCSESTPDTYTPTPGSTVLPSSTPTTTPTGNVPDPSATPTTDPTGRPTDIPTVVPTSTPTERPTDVPPEPTVKPGCNCGLGNLSEGCDPNPHACGKKTGEENE